MLFNGAKASQARNDDGYQRQPAGDGAGEACCRTLTHLSRRVACAKAGAATSRAKIRLRCGVPVGRTRRFGEGMIHGKDPGACTV